MSLKKGLSIVLVFFCIFLLTECDVYEDIYSDYDHTVDFTKYKTFAWVPDSGMTARTDSFRNTAYDNDVIRNNAKNFISAQLMDRGLRVHTNEPDALFQLVLLNEKKERIVTENPPYYPQLYYYGSARHYPYYYDGRMYYPYYYPYYDNYTYYGWGCTNSYCAPETYKQTYVKGTITINMFDRKQKKLIWTASAEGNIYGPSSLKEDVDPAIRKMMKVFPIKDNGRKNSSDDMYVKR
jgi:hypothetical protein